MLTCNSLDVKSTTYKLLSLFSNLIIDSAKCNQSVKMFKELTTFHGRTLIVALTLTQLPLLE